MGLRVSTAGNVLKIVTPSPFLRLDEIITRVRTELIQRGIIRYDPFMNVGLVRSLVRDVVLAEGLGEGDVDACVYYWAVNSVSEEIRDLVPVFLVRDVWAVWVLRDGGVWVLYNGRWLRPEVDGNLIEADADRLTQTKWFTCNEYGCVMDLLRVVTDKLPTTETVYDYLRDVVTHDAFRVRIIGNMIPAFITRIANEVPGLKYFIRKAFYPLPKDCFAVDEFDPAVASAFPCVVSCEVLPCATVKGLRRFIGLCDCDLEVTVLVDGVDVVRVFEDGKEVYSDGAWVGRPRFGRVRLFD